jgi:hypothetical protein
MVACSCVVALKLVIAVIVIEYAAAANQRYLSGSTDENEAKG